MNILYLLMGASLLMAVGFLAGFIWATRSGQFEDPQTPSMRMLTDDEEPRAATPEKGARKT